MKNDFEIRGDHVAIFLDNTDGTRVETLIDLDDLDKAKMVLGKWRATRVNLTAPYYVYGIIKITREDGHPENRNIALARLIMDFPKGLVVDHIDEVTLDNRKKNLQAITNSENIKKQMWRKKGKRVQDTLRVRHVRCQVRDSDYKLIAQEASKHKMSVEKWLSLVISKEINVKPWFREYENDSVV